MYMINMSNNYDLLKEKVKKCKNEQKEISKYIDSIELPQLKNKRIYILKRDYPNLISSLKDKSICSTEIIKINEEAEKDYLLRLFLFYNFYRAFETYSKKKELSMDGQIFVLEEFGLSLGGRNFCSYLWFGYNQFVGTVTGQKNTFKKIVIEPMKKIAKILKVKLNTNDKSYCNFEKNDMIKQEIQNFLYHLQKHKFYEDYIARKIKKTKKLGNKEYINNPVIIFNPHFVKDNEFPGGRLDGYFELDGAIVLSNPIEFIECKNTAEVKFEHITNFVGKCAIFEKIYDIKVVKKLYCTGKNNIWSGIQSYDGLDLDISDNDL